MIIFENIVVDEYFEKTLLLIENFKNKVVNEKQCLR